MIDSGFLIRTLKRPPLAGAHALLFGLVAVAAPTLVHDAVVGNGVALAFIVYVPSVVLAAVFMRSWHAALLAFACAAAGDWFFLEQQKGITFSASDLVGVPVFLFSSALILGGVRAMKSLLHVTFSPNAAPSKVIFSEEKGHAWAHWHGDRPSLPRGPHEEVADMMEDYLAQVELGKRLTGEKRRFRRAKR